MEGGEEPPAKRVRGARGGKNRPSKQRWAQNQALKLGVIVPCKFPSSASSSDKIAGEAVGVGTTPGSDITGGAASSTTASAGTTPGSDLPSEAAIASKTAQGLDPAGEAASKTASPDIAVSEAASAGPSQCPDLAGSGGPLPGPGPAASASTSASAAPILAAPTGDRHCNRIRERTSQICL